VVFEEAELELDTVGSFRMLARSTSSWATHVYADSSRPFHCH
jgi:hypothetical protein